MYAPSEQHFLRLRQAAPGADFAVAGDEASAAAAIADADVVLGNRFFVQSLPWAARLRWMQSNSMGVDRILECGGARLRNVVVTCARGLYADEVADHALALLLGVTRGLRTAVEHHGRREWGRWTLQTLAGSRCLVLGWGETGIAIGRRLAGFGVAVQGVRRRGAPQPAVDTTGVVVHGPTTWRAELPRCDILMIALPLTDETRGCVAEAELDALPPHAVVVNVGRGAVLDEAALFDRLRGGRLWGAGLDTLAREPAEPGHPVWDVPRLLLTPHVARSLEQGPPRWERLFEENLGRFVRGDPLLHVVDQSAGY